MTKYDKHFCGGTGPICRIVKQENIPFRLFVVVEDGGSQGDT